MKIEWTLILNKRIIKASTVSHIVDKIASALEYDYEDCKFNVELTEFDADLDADSFGNYFKISIEGTTNMPAEMHDIFFIYMSEIVEQIEEDISKLAESKCCMWLYMDDHRVNRELYNGMNENKANKVELAAHRVFLPAKLAAFLSVIGVAMIVWHTLFPSVNPSMTIPNIISGIVFLLVVLQIVVLKKQKKPKS